MKNFILDATSMFIGCLLAMFSWEAMTSAIAKKRPIAIHLAPGMQPEDVAAAVQAAFDARDALDAHK
ncbi:MAG TPA: hypothetical protein VLI45_09255 [Acidobacteriaceae bacterium]|nr:hypothetical protein [Acidobacteriaceae bacterium]